MKNAIIRILILMIASLFLSGCGPPTTDVTSSPDYNFSSFYGMVCKTKVKMALADFKEYTGAKHTYLFVPSRFDSSQPNYVPLPGMKIIAVLPPGTWLRIEQLIQDNGEGSQLWVTGTLIDTTNSEKTVYLDQLMLANNRFIDRGPTSSTNWGVNTDMLEAVTNTP